MISSLDASRKFIFLAYEFKDIFILRHSSSKKIKQPIQLNKILETFLYVYKFKYISPSYLNYNILEIEKKKF